MTNNHTLVESMMKKIQIASNPMLSGQAATGAFGMMSLFGNHNDIVGEVAKFCQEYPHLLNTRIDGKTLLDVAMRPTIMHDVESAILPGIAEAGRRHTPLFAVAEVIKSHGGRTAQALAAPAPTTAVSQR